MAALTIRNVDKDVKRRLRIRAAERGRSMEAELRDILRRAAEEAAGDEAPDYGLGTRIHARFKALGGVDLEITPPGPMRPLPDFTE